MYIDPVTCIDCAACEPACPVSAIFIEADVPAKWQHFVKKNADFFKE
jgi:NAD-dependent dihydropyrimidine dehydrogenase PreA subunit